MKYLILTIALLFAACSNPTEPSSNKLNGTFRSTSVITVGHNTTYFWASVHNDIVDSTGYGSTLESYVASARKYDAVSITPTVRNGYTSFCASGTGTWYKNADTIRFEPTQDTTVVMQLLRVN